MTLVSGMMLRGNVVPLLKTRMKWFLKTLMAVDGRALQVWGTEGRVFEPSQTLHRRRRPM